jgi:hypothetical protein
MFVVNLPDYVSYAVFELADGWLDALTPASMQSRRALALAVKCHPFRTS